jgi:hypothetical protein
MLAGQDCLRQRQRFAEKGTWLGRPEPFYPYSNLKRRSHMKKWKWLVLALALALGACGGGGGGGSSACVWDTSNWDSGCTWAT